MKTNKEYRQFIKDTPNDDSLLSALQARFWERLINEKFKENIDKMLSEIIEKEK